MGNFRFKRKDYLFIVNNRVLHVMTVDDARQWARFCLAIGFAFGLGFFAFLAACAALLAV